MRISSLNPNTPGSSESEVGESRITPSPGERSVQAPAREKPATSPRQATGALSKRDPLFNEQLSRAQQSLNYLEQMASRLQSLKSELSARIARNQYGDVGLDRKLQGFAELWRQRQEFSGGGIDGQLAYTDGNETRQRFAIRGLDLRSLQSGDKETLTFSVGSDSTRLLSVIIEPGLPSDILVRRLDRAFAAANIRVLAGKNGEPVFSVPESVWPSVRDTLAVRGKGIRFPSGQLTRARTEPEADAIRPESWQAEDLAALRRILQEITNALDRIRQVQQYVSRILAQARSRFEASPLLQDGEWASNFVADFETMAQQTDYPVFTAVAPALTSISRQRVQALLALD